MARYKNFRGNGGAGVQLDKSCTSCFSLSAIIFSCLRNVRTRKDVLPYM